MTDAVQHLDIQADKAIEWCVNRGQLQGDWLTSLKSVQGKVKNALANPAYAISADVQRQIEEQGMTYWACLAAIDTISAQLLTQRGHAVTDTGKLKNFFGSYTDPSLKALTALVALYRKQNLFLAEGARCLVQAVSYDIPQLRKLIQTNTKQNEDLLRKISEETRAARDLKAKQQQQLKENWRISFAGADLPQQLKKRAEEDVPELINAVITATKDAKFGEAIEYYREFVRYCLQDTASPSTDAPPFPTLLSIRSSDLLVVSAVQPDEAPQAAAAVEIHAGGIDWGISVEGAGDASGAAAATIDWDITCDDAGTALPAAGGSIDWGDDDDSAAAGTTGTVNWDIETTESGAVDEAPSASPSLSSPSSIVVPVSSLESDATRHSFLSELQELEAFIAERVHDLATSDDVATAAFQGSNVPHILALQSQQTAQAYLTSVRTCLTALRSPRLTQLLMIRTSKRFVERVVAGIRQQSASVERLERAAIEHESRRLELLRVSSRSSMELSALVSKTRTIKGQMERAISELFQNRPVHIVGEINNLLQQ